MTFTIEIGWWVVPALITLAAAFWTWREIDPLAGAFTMLIAVIASLFAWCCFFAIGWWLA